MGRFLVHDDAGDQSCSVRWRVGIAFVVAAYVVVGEAHASDMRLGPVTQVYLGSKFYGSMTYVPAHDGYSPYWNLSRRILTSAASLDIVFSGGEIVFESEGND
jgi:hypothetical protein